MPTPRFSGGTNVTSSTTRLPAMSMAPAAGTSRPAIRRRRVLLPLPLGPRTPRISPFSTDSENPSMTAGSRRSSRGFRSRRSSPLHPPFGHVQDGHRQKAHGDDQKGRQGRLDDLLILGVPVGLGGQRLEIERPEQERQRQLLANLHKGQQKAYGNRSPQERHFHPERRPRPAVPEQARRFREPGADALVPGLHGVVARRGKTDDI